MASKSQAVPRPIALDDLLDGIETGTIVLPAFQRDFDWNTTEVVSLLSTLMRGWPAGSLLLMDGEPDFFRTREFEGAPAKAGETEFVVLDGQQRLTALYRTLRNVGDEVYALRYDDELLEDAEPGAEELQDRIAVIDREEWESSYPLERQVQERLIPLHTLRTAPDFFEWRDRAAAAPGARDSVSSELSRIYRNFLGTLNHYDFPSVVLPKRTPSEAVARIFERINRQGRRLTTFDLMVARTYEPGWNLRDLWDQACQESRDVDMFFRDDGLPAIQLISLKEKEDVRQPAVLSLQPEHVHQQWDQSIAALTAAVHQVKRYGAIRPDWLPYRSQLLTLGGLAWDRDLADYGSALEEWFWGSSFGGTYDVGSSTRVVTDVRAFEEAARVGGEPIERPFVGIDALAASTRRKSPATWRAFMSLLNRAQAQDLITGAVVDNGEPSDSVIVSIFPKQQDRRAVGYHLRVFGLIRVSRPTARQLRSTSIHRALRDTGDANEIDERLSSQLLPGYEELLELYVEPLQILEFRVQRALGFLRELLGDLPVQLEREARA